jgi:histidinol-phosphatase (PHP family)
MYPHPELLTMFREAGVPITLASDAHDPQDCARDREVALAFAYDAGYVARIRFSRRRASTVALELRSTASQEQG